MFDAAEVYMENVLSGTVRKNACSLYPCNGPTFNYPEELRGSEHFHVRSSLQCTYISENLETTLTHKENNE